MTLVGLAPNARCRAQAALDELDDRGVPYVVTSTVRTYMEQAALYAQGRNTLIVVNSRRSLAGMAPIGDADNKYTVTRCDGTPSSQGPGHARSPHQIGIALDVVPRGKDGPEWPPASDPRWEQIAMSFESQGFKWGGRWKDFLDLPHYQYPT